MRKGRQTWGLTREEGPKRQSCVCISPPEEIVFMYVCWGRNLRKEEKRRDGFPK